jgi:hypothetical protein
MDAEHSRGLADELAVAVAADKCDQRAVADSKIRQQKKPAMPCGKDERPTRRRLWPV